MSFYKITRRSNGEIIVYGGGKKVPHGEVYPILLQVLGEDDFIAMLKQDDGEAE